MAEVSQGVIESSDTGPFASRQPKMRIGIETTHNTTAVAKPRRHSSGPRIANSSRSRWCSAWTWSHELARATIARQCRCSVAHAHRAAAAAELMFPCVIPDRAFLGVLGHRLDVIHGAQTGSGNAPHVCAFVRRHPPLAPYDPRESDERKAHARPIQAWQRNPTGTQVQPVAIQPKNPSFGAFPPT